MNPQPEWLDTARVAILSFAEARDANLAAWIAAEATFPNSMVDRIAPRVSGEDRTRLNAKSGIDDHLPASTEFFTQWVVQDRFAGGRPDLARAGVELREDVPAFEAIKGRLLNASHMLLAYPALLCGYRLVHEAVGDRRLAGLLDAFMERDVIPHLVGPPGVSLAAYKDKAIERFSNPAIGDQLLRIAHDGCSKIPVFHTKTLEQLLANGGDVRREAFFLACFGRYFLGRNDAGSNFPVHEPQLSEDDRGRIVGGDPLGLLRITAFRALRLDENGPFRDAFVANTMKLAERGTKATLEELLAS